MARIRRDHRWRGCAQMAQIRVFIVNGVDADDTDEH